MPSMEYMERDQKILPRPMSQSHSPQRPRSSAASSREVATASVWRLLRVCVACQLKAAAMARITEATSRKRPTSPSALSFHEPSMASTGCTSASVPGHGSREIVPAMAFSPLGKMIRAKTGAPVSLFVNVPGRMSARRRGLSMPASEGQTAWTMPSASATIHTRPCAVAPCGMACARSSEVGSRHVPRSPPVSALESSSPASRRNSAFWRSSPSTWVRCMA